MKNTSKMLAIAFLTGTLALPAMASQAADFNDNAGQILLANRHDRGDGWHGREYGHDNGQHMGNRHRPDGPDMRYDGQRPDRSDMRRGPNGQRPDRPDMRPDGRQRPDRPDMRPDGNRPDRPDMRPGRQNNYRPDGPGMRPGGPNGHRPDGLPGAPNQHPGAR